MNMIKNTAREVCISSYYPVQHVVIEAVARAETGISRFCQQVRLIGHGSCQFVSSTSYTRPSYSDDRKQSVHHSELVFSTLVCGVQHLFTIFRLRKINHKGLQQELNPVESF